MLRATNAVRIRALLPSWSLDLQASTSRRHYAAPSSRRSAPMAQLKEDFPEQDLPPYVQEVPSEPRDLRSYNASREPIYLPTLLPPDAISTATPAHHIYYPGANILDSTSMISICLRRRENIPRAYQIYKQLIESVEKEEAAIPDAELFAKVAEGTASMWEKNSAAGDAWRIRAKRVAEDWTNVHKVAKGKPVTTDRGYKVYAGWLTGLVKAGAPLDDIMPYLMFRRFNVEILSQHLRPQDLPTILQVLSKFAHERGLPGLAKEVDAIQGRNTRTRMRAAYHEPEKLVAVQETKGHNGEISLQGEDRFEVQNLRRALMHINSPATALERQRDLEAAVLDAAKRQLAHSAKVYQTSKLESSGRAPSHTNLAARAFSQDRLQAWMHEWVTNLTERLKSEIAEMKRRQVEAAQQALKAPPKIGRPGKIRAYVSNGHSTTAESTLLLYLALLPPDKLALITVLETMKTMGTGNIEDGAKIINATGSIGRGVESEYQADTMKELFGTNSPTWARLVEEAGRMPYHRATSSLWKWIGGQLEDESNSNFDRWRHVWAPTWHFQAHFDVGGYLLAQLLDVAKVERMAIDPMSGEEVSETQSAFAHSYEYVRGHKLGLVRLNPVVASRLSFDRIGATLDAKSLPMLVEPRPWTGHDVGAYLMNRVEIMRHKDSPEQAAYLRQAIADKVLEPVLHGLDVLSATSWQINRQVYETMSEVWNSGQELADIPPTDEMANYIFPDQLRGQEKNDTNARREYLEKLRNVNARQRRNHSERCRINYTLEVARSFLNDTFYLPHNMDFRGRAYPIPPFLSPVGDDLNRGLLTFSEKKPLGTTGLKWLRIHLANVYGYDKLSFAEREKFAAEHEAEIMDSADKPLEGSRWWADAEDPWQCLAACIELSKALRCPDPTAFESSLPVHQDGTCNGMQHYAALGGDVRGAKAVNLENGDRPADIYTRVVEIVNRVIEKDKQAGIIGARLIKEPLQRKIVKQTVMTTVYGVTFIGAKDQIAKQLMSRTDIATADLWIASGYIARVVLNCIGDLFSGAKSIQNWLTACARLISRSMPPDRALVAAGEIDSAIKETAVSRYNKEHMSPVIWETPLGLPVVQPYRKPKRKQVMTAMQSLYITDPTQPSEVSSSKQASAFPPNFVHSLDATHMYLTALACRRAGLTFASVHDSYWTHAASVEHMSELIREAFIDLHSQDLIGELRDNFLARYGNNLVLPASARSICHGALKRQAADTAHHHKVQEALDEARMDGDITDVGQVDAIGSITADATENTGSTNFLKPPELSASRASDLKEALSAIDATIAKNTIKIGSQRFVRLRDVLPSAPKRGLFDVNRIKDSAYFFS